MTDTPTATSRTVNTVLGLVPADDLGVVSVHEALLSVVPGAEHAYDIIGLHELTQNRFGCRQPVRALLADRQRERGR
jgi:hypothetical protein